MGISTHILDTSRGRPAASVPVTLEIERGGWDVVAMGRTDNDGRLRLVNDAPEAGTYRITFATGEYFGGDTFFPEVSIVFTIQDASQHYHVPLLLSPYGYSTYRGS
jgi:5-hydroxyisourate hydrolase